MKIKNLLSGIAAMLVAVGMAFGFNTVSNPYGAYLDGGVCKPIETPCVIQPGVPCEEPLGPEGLDIPIYFNENYQNNSLPPTCDDPLYRPELFRMW
jgi:hypothetical protein